MASHPLRRIEWASSFRLIPSRFPPVEIYQGVVPVEDWDAVKRIETLTNPRLRERDSGLGYLLPEDRDDISQNWVVAPFTYPDPDPTAFSDGSYGVCVVAETAETALIEAVRRREIFLRRTGEGKMRLDMRMLKTPLRARLHDLTSANNLDDPSVTQRICRELREAKSYGLLVPGRSETDRLAVVLRPTAFERAVQAEHYAFIWDGEKIDRIYDYSEGKVIDPFALG